MINIIGMGLDGIAGLNTQMLEKIEHSSVLAGSERLVSYVSNFVGKKIIFDNLAQGIAEIQEYDQQDQEITILATGDPLFFGIGRLLLQHFTAENLSFYPHLSSIQLAFNQIKIPWHDAEIMSVHGRSLENLIPLWKKGAKKIFILTDRVNNPQAIASLYCDLDLPVHYDFYICENLGSNQAQFYQFNSPVAIEKLSQQKTNFEALNVVILIRQDLTNTELNLQNLPLIGIPDQNFLSFSDRPSLLTKREIRLQILGQLNLQPKQIVWDLGAGTGSVSIEIARLCPTSRIYAIEKTAMGISLIEQNSQRFQVSNITAINGEAPLILQELPNPERIFIGGSGGNLSAILEYCLQKLKINGILVLALTTLEHFHHCLNYCQQAQLDYDVIHLQISRSVAINHLTRLSPLNPISLISVTKNIDI
jgi:precorrin-6B C5,15-methyltransferase / cobalt-precorrin-6B C5,C15-methyltransferase